MRRAWIISAAAAAVLALKAVHDHKKEETLRDHIRWLHARCDGYDKALELLLDGESGAF